MSNISSILNKNRVKSIFVYAENPVSDKVVEFGWAEGNIEHLKSPIVIAKPSRSTKNSKKDRDSAKKKGANVANLSDYIRYFTVANNHSSPYEFWDEWKLKEDEFVEHYTFKVVDSDVPDMPRFIYRLAELIVNYRSFSMYGFYYKVVEI